MGVEWLERQVLGGGVAVLCSLLWVGCTGAGPFKKLQPSVDLSQEDSSKVALQILSFNDFHGHLAPPNGSNGRVGDMEVGGLAHLAAHLHHLREGQPHTITVSAGDLIGASPLVSALFHDEPTITLMSDLGLEINGVGNHEFDEGWEELERMQQGGCHPVDGCVAAPEFEGAKFSFLAANVTHKDTGKPVFPGVVVRQFDGVEVGFIGLTFQGTAGIVSQEGIQSVRFGPEAAVIDAAVAELQERGVEAIVVLVHEGGRQTGGHDECVGMSGAIVDLVEETDDAVDVFVTGHTHKAYNCMLDGSIVTSAASYGRLVTEIQLTLDRVTGDVIEATARNHPVTRDQSDLKVAQAIAHYTALAAPLAQRVVGHIGQDLTRTKDPAGQSALGGVVADAHLAAMQLAEFGGADVAFMNAGGLRADLMRSPTGIEVQEGVVTYEEVFAAQPFGNVLAVQTFSGAQFIALLEEQFTVGSLLQVSSTLQYTFSASAAPGSKVEATSVKVNGELVKLDDEVRVVINGYVADGGDGFTLFAAGKDRHNGPVDVDALAAYLGARDSLGVPAPARVIRLP